MENQKPTVNKTAMLVVGAFVVVVLGVGSAWLISSKVVNKVSNTTGAAPGAKVSDTEAGMLDPNVKYDNATGNLVEGGIANEGIMHLEREGGPSKYVYLTSSVVNLSSFTGKKVEVWGQTLASKKAGWLIDVAKIKIVE